MKQLEGKMIVTYRWWRSGGREIVSDHVDALNKSALDRIMPLLSEGYVQGELYNDTRMTDDDKNGAVYLGWWEVIKSN